MNLVRHIAKKDLRRMMVPVAWWLVLLVAGTLWFRLSSPASDGELNYSVAAWFGIMRIGSALFTGGQFVVGFIFVGALWLEDPLQGTAQFWPTRPIGAWRLLIAKIVSVALLFIAVPIAVLTPIWLASGLNLGEIAVAAGEFAKWQGLVSLLALALAGPTANLAQFLFVAVGGVTVLMFAKLYVPRDVIWFSVAPLAGAIFGHNYIVRRGPRMWLAIGAAVVAVLGIFCAGQSGVFDRPESRRLAAAPLAPEVKLQYDHEVHKYRSAGSGPLWISVTLPWSRNEFFVPVRGVLGDGRLELTLWDRWEVAGRRALGFDRGEDPIRWKLEFDGLVVVNGRRTFVADDRLTSGQEPQFLGQFEIWRTRAQVLGEIPLREGTRFEEEAGYTRIIGFARTDQQIDHIFLEEKGSHRAQVALDYYFLIDRKAGTARLLHSSLIGSLEMNSLIVSGRDVGVPGTSDGHDLTLAKVRFERLQVFEYPFELRGLVYERNP